MASMPKPRLPFLRREKSRHGKTKWYFRAGNGPRIRLPDDYSTLPGSEFMEAYNAALGKPQDASKPRSRYPQNTLGWLLDQYQQSVKFTNLARETRDQRTTIIKNILSKNSATRLTDITERSIRRGREKRAATPAAANNWLKTMRAAFSWGVDSGLLDGVIDTDPTANVKSLSTKSTGYHTWSVEEIEAFEAHWPLGTKPRLALDLMLYTGLRRNDAYQVGLQHIKDGEIHIKTQKEGVWVYLPILPPLQDSINAAQTGNLTLMTTHTGQPFKTNKTYGEWFVKRCREAGVPGTAHGLRKAGAVLAAERGATVHQMMAIFGWKSEQMPTRYTEAANRKKMGLEHGQFLDRK
jgi:integrase